ncbi:hypothetical protein [Selenihalanaerobacter shriftii]|uniref:Sulfotransferase family protein n=1 Tax=Selenihalanaerobacter shriftii TaxID=142842 RepID=A0A1T4KLY8_9FIRM|nr:hypothetical protein [Selenihalanaerobacter shriftii]SJZ43452.1 hypothetical protein SAMN02745118_00835 [Selenihalanaerobacter shriftii]
MDVGFLHIGMPKTASTYMQNIWLKDESYSLSWKGNIKFLEQLRSAVKKGNLNKNLKVDINTDINYQEGQKLVISNEGFSSAYMNEVEFQHKIPEFIDYSSRILGQLSGTTTNLLIVVRDPISWMKSVFVQAIKQGWNGCAENFVHDQYNLLKYSLDLKFILKCYRRYFDNVLIVPFEILKDDEDRFWNIISKKFEVPFAKTRTQKINKSFDLKKVFILSKLNKMSSALLNTLEGSKEYAHNYSEEKDKLLNMYSHGNQWVPRRFVEFANKEQLDEIYNLFNISGIPKDFLSFNIPDELIEIIKSKYIEGLKDNIDSNYVSFYEQQLQDYISG